VSAAAARAEVPAGAAAVLRRLKDAGHEAWLVGGCVRDLLLGRKPKDWDVTTDARPEQVEALFEKTVAVGKAFGIVTVLPGGGEAPVEVATYRADSPDTPDGRHPASISFSDAREDALRRDFTVNALYLDPETGEIRDETGGRADLAARRIRAIGDAERRFREDALRMLRAVRFAAVLGFGIEEGTMAAVQANTALLGNVSAERIRDELCRMFTEAPDASRALHLLDESGLLAAVLPEVAAMHGVEQPPEFHPEGDVFVHTAKMLGMMPFPRSTRLALGVLLHDVGKPPTAAYKRRKAGGEWRWTFESHAAVGAGMADAILRRLRAPNALREDVVRLVADHMRLADAPSMRAGKLRRLLGDPLFGDLLELHRLDCLSCHGQLDKYEFLRVARARFAAEPVLPPPLVRGRDLVAAGLAPGPEFKDLLQKAYDLQLEGTGDKASILAAILPPEPGSRRPPG
jgi:poly(A) polymerase